MTANKPFTQDNQMQKEVISALNDAIDANSLGYSCVEHLGSIFVALGALAPDNKRVGQVVSTAMYLVEDWCNLLDVQREDCENKRKQLIEGARP